MNGDTPKKPVEGDWQTEKHDASSQADTPKSQPQAGEVVVANLRDEPTPEKEPKAEDRSAPETPTIDKSQARFVPETPSTPDEAPAAAPEIPAISEEVPKNDNTTAPLAPQNAGWTTTMNGESAWELADAEMEAQDVQAVPAAPSIQWTASEFIAHEKSPTWYLSLIGTGAVLAIFSQLVAHDPITTVAVVLITILFVFAASHKPRTLPYRIDDTGITIGNKTYLYGQFKSFGIVQEGAFSNITLVPLKRFGQPLSIYYPPEEEGKIVDVLSAYMPASQVRLDFIDRLLKSIHL